MANTVKLKRSAVAGKVPVTGDLQLGELALNTNDGVLFFKRDVSGTESIVKVGTTTNLLSYIRVTSNTTAVSRQSYIADTSAGSFTLTLPTSPASGDWVTVVDGSSFLTNALTIGRNFATIEGIADDLSLNISGVSVTFVFDGTTWEVFTQVGAQGGTEVTLGGVQTLTNKTLSLGSNTITGTVAQFNAAVTDGDFVTLSGTETLTNKTFNGTTIIDVLRRKNSNTQSFSQIYNGGATGQSTGYLDAGEYQPYLTITPSGNSNNYQVVGRIVTQSGGNSQIINFQAALRSDTLPQLSWSTSYSEELNGGTAYFTPVVWVNETGIGSAQFILALNCNATVYGSVTVDVDVITRYGNDFAASVFNVTNPSEVTTIPANFTSYTFTRNSSNTPSSGTNFAYTPSVNGVAIPTLTSSNTLTNKTLTSPTINAGALSGTFSGDATLSGLINLSYTGAGSTSSLTIGGYNSKGGTGYHDFLKVTNGYGSATNPSKWFRLSSLGALEIVNSAYTNTLFYLSDTGDLTLAGNLTMDNRPAFRVVGNGGQISATTTITSAHWTLDYQQGSALNTSTGIFTAPKSGLYQTYLVMRTAANNNSGINQAIIRKTAVSGGAVTSQAMLEFGANTSMNHTGVGTIVRMVAGDTLKVDVTAGTLSFDGNDNWSVAYIG